VPRDDFEALPRLTEAQDETGQYIPLFGAGGINTLASGCPVTLSLNARESAYCRIWIPAGAVLRYEWEASQPFVVFYDWHVVPHYVSATVDGQFSADYNGQPQTKPTTP